MSTFYRLNAFLARQLGRVLGRGHAEVRGMHHVPRRGAFILVANHESFLDPILIQAFCPRQLHSMAKSTQFGAPVLGPWMRRLLAYPVRRFQVDPQAVRMTLRRLDQGEGVAIYVEGERSWTGEMQPPRRGAVKIALKAGVPVVPCAISGAYEMLPRWGHTLRTHPLRITFGPSLSLPQCDERSERERQLPAASQEIEQAIRTLNLREAAAVEP